MADVEGLEINREGGLAVVTLTRPERRNAIDVETCRALTAYLRDVDADRSVRSVVITGVDHDFCTGADAVGSNRAVTDTMPLDYRWATRDFNDLFETLWRIEVPVVSAVNGTVAGAGWLLALLADLCADLIQSLPQLSADSIYGHHETNYNHTNACPGKT